MEHPPIHQVLWGLQQMWVSVDFAEHIRTHLLHHVHYLVEFERLLAKVGVHLLAGRLQAHSWI